MTDSRQAHWDKIYASKSVTDVSWYEVHPWKSLELIRATGTLPTDPIIDVGGGASFLVDELLDGGYLDLTVLDISAEVLQKLRERLGPQAAAVTLLQQDVAAFHPTRRYALWHDRAVFHFLIQPEDREHYVDSLRRALLPWGHVIIATFGPSGPERCSGLAVMRYNASALAAELGSDFGLVDSSLAVHLTPRGVAQQFLYCRFGRHTRGGVTAMLKLPGPRRSGR
jgi:SAM-dependent methyltransferase